MSRKNLRKISEIWGNVDQFRPETLSKKEWKRSFDGVKLAIESIGYKLKTTKEEFEKLEIPQRKAHKSNDYARRKIIISRDNVESKPTEIGNILNGNSKFLSKEEMQNIYVQMSKTVSDFQPKGVPTTNDSEKRSIEDLHELLGINKILKFEHLLEHRVADVCYALIDDHSGIFFPEQVKSSKCNKKSGICDFSVTVAEMTKILEKGMSLLCIGKNSENEIEIIWFFYGEEAILMLAENDQKLRFQPKLHLLTISSKKFTNDHNNPNFRFNMKNEADRKRFLEKKLDIIEKGKKNTIKFFNEDFSQILSSNHRREQESFAMTREACQKIGVTVSKNILDNYTSTDFRINDQIRIQDKVCSTSFGMKRSGALPYNADDFDVFQITLVEEKIVYAIPMRVIKDELIVSFFTEKELMTSGFWFSEQRKNLYSKYKFDFNDEEQIQAYVESCKKAYNIPKLSDECFYKNLIAKNTDKFGSKKQMIARKKI